MTSKDFIKKYSMSTNVKTSDEDRMRCVKQILNIVPYITYAKKCEIIESLLLRTSHSSSAVIQKTFVDYMLKYYTDLEVIENTYDILEETNTLKYVIALFQIEYERCMQILNMYLDDLQTGRITYEELLSTDK